MKTRFLLPASFRKTGWVLVCLSLAAYTVFHIFHLPQTLLYLKIPVFYDPGMPQIGDAPVLFKSAPRDIGYTLFNLCFIAGLLLVAFSKLKTEDEYMMRLRLESMVWAVYANFVVILVANILLFGFGFLWVLMLNMYTIPILFIVRFYYTIQKSKNKLAHAE